MFWSWDRLGPMCVCVCLGPLYRKNKDFGVQILPVFICFSAPDGQIDPKMGQYLHFMISKHTGKTDFWIFDFAILTPKAQTWHLDWHVL